MQQTTDNMQKYENYRIQMGRLKKAIACKFYLEAIFIEYAIMEDRLESALRHSGKWNQKQDEHISLYRKVKKIEKLAEQKKSLASKYFKDDLLKSVLSWKDDRNTVVHALLKQDVNTDELLAVVERGNEIVKNLCNKTSLFNRALEKQKR